MKNNTTPLSLGTDNIGSLLLRYALPAIVATTSSSLYNIADSVFIGQGVGAMAIAGLALSLPLMNFAAAFGAMVGVGASSIISIRLGQGNKRSAEQTLANVVLLNVIIGITISILSLSFLDPILYFFGASDSTITFARDYMRIILAGNVISHLFLGLNEVMRASGYPRKAMGVVITAVVVNVLINPLLIFGLDWGVKGAAVATIISQCVALVIVLAHFFSPSSFLKFRRGRFVLKRSIVWGIISIGCAPFLINCCASVVVVFVNSALKSYGGEMGDVYIGSYGIINRVALLFIMIIIGLNQGMQPIVGYNYGAKQYDRILKALKITILCAVSVTTTGFLICQLLPQQVAMMFVGSGTDATTRQMIEITSRGMHIVFAMFPFVGFQVVVGSFFQYIGKAKKAILMSTTRQVIFLLPLLTFLPSIIGVEGVWYAMPISDISATTLAAILLTFQVRKFRQLKNQSIQ